MSNVRSENTDSETKITDADLEKAVQLLTGNIAEIEGDILKRTRALRKTAEKNREKNKRDELKKIKDKYEKKDLQDFVSTLRTISIQLFKEIKDFNQVKLYKKREDTPSDYLCYLNSAQNLPDLIIKEILYQLDANAGSFDEDRALLVLRRWILVMRGCLEKNDFFTSGSILFALCSAPISRSTLTSKLRKNVRSILEDYRKMFDKPEMIYNIQEKKLEKDEEIIPALSTLTRVIEKFRDHDEALVSDAKRRATERYSGIQAKLLLEQNEKTQLIIEEIHKRPDPGLRDLYWDRGTDVKLYVLKASLLQLRSDLIICEADYQRPKNQCEENVATVIGLIRTILRDGVLSHQEKLNKIADLLKFGHYEFNIKLSKIFEDIQFTLKKIITLQQSQKEKQTKKVEAEPAETRPIIEADGADKVHKKHNVKKIRKRDSMSDIDRCKLGVVENVGGDSYRSATLREETEKKFGKKVKNGTIRKMTHRKKRERANTEIKPPLPDSVTNLLELVSLAPLPEPIIGITQSLIPLSISGETQLSPNCTRQRSHTLPAPDSDNWNQLPASTDAIQDPTSVSMPKLPLESERENKTDYNDAVYEVIAATSQRKLQTRPRSGTFPEIAPALELIEKLNPSHVTSIVESRDHVLVKTNSVSSITRLFEAVIQKQEAIRRQNAITSGSNAGVSNYGMFSSQPQIVKTAHSEVLKKTADPALHIPGRSNSSYK